jgi:hypothetical protein
VEDGRNPAERRPVGVPAGRGIKWFGRGTRRLLRFGRTMSERLEVREGAKNDELGEGWESSTKSAPLSIADWRRK